MTEAPHVGTVLADRYELARHLARGGMGDVYEAQDRVLDRRVAVKLFRATAPVDRTRFDAEVRVLASLNHPGLVPVFDAGSVGDDAFVVLELIDGPPLRAELDGRRLPPERVASLATQLAEALAYIHGRGVVHRDVTPSNVLCTGDGRVRLVDFGIARLLDAPRVTSPDLAIGTAAYMAPEQVQGHDVTGAADIYALGLVLLEALTGTKAFPGPAVETSVVRLTRDPDTTTGVPGAWSPLLADMTARDPMARPTATQVQARVAALASSADRSTAAAAVAAPPVVALASRDRARRRRVPAWALGTAAAVVAAVVLVLADGGAGPGSGDPVDAATTSTVTGAAAASSGRAGRATRSGDATAVSSTPLADDSASAADEDPTPTSVDPAAAGRWVVPPTTRRSSSTTVAPTTTAPPATTTTAPPPTTTSPPTTAPATTSPPTTAAPAG